MERTVGIIDAVNRSTGEVRIIAPANLAKIDAQGIRSCEVVFRDPREITADQRKKIYATLKDISDYTGDEVEALKDYFKALYVELTGGAWLSLSDCSEEDATAFLDMLIEFCVRKDIPLSDDPIGRAPDTSRYLYACLMAHRCSICGRRSELHHWTAVGSGRNRKEICHLGMDVIALCRTHHTEVHQIGKVDFGKKYSVYGIKADAAICREYGLRMEVKK